MLPSVVAGFYLIRDVKATRGRLSGCAPRSQQSHLVPSLTSPVLPFPESEGEIMLGEKPGFRDQFGPLIAWVGIVGSAITLFSNLQGVLDMADWARWIVAHWTEWMHAFWSWIFAWFSIKLPPPLALLLTAYAFLSMLAGAKHVEVKQTSYLGILGAFGRVFCILVLVVPIVVVSDYWPWFVVALSPALLHYALIIYRTRALPAGVRFSWKPVFVALTVLLLLALNVVSQLDLAPLLKAPKV
jgi:hypothetical protein